MRGPPALAFVVGAALAVSSCTAPLSITFFNASGQRLSILKCNGKRLSVAPGASGRFEWRELKCHVTQPFVIERADGKSWRYPSMPGNPFALAAGQSGAFDGFRGINPGARIDPDGAISLLPEPGLEVRHQPQPLGYPMKPTGE